MEQFSLEKYLANPSRNIATRKGRPVRILCTDLRSSNGYPIVAAIECGGGEYIETFKENGRCGSLDKDDDLFFAPREGWINIALGSISVFPTEEEAKKHLKTNGVKTVKIEWEE